MFYSNSDNYYFFSREKMRELRRGRGRKGGREKGTKEQRSLNWAVLYFAEEYHEDNGWSIMIELATLFDRALKQYYQIIPLY